MTRKQALLIAYNAINDEQAKNVIQELIKSFPWHEWSEAAIYDAIDQFIADNGRTPTPTDFKYSKVLPQGATIQNRMKMTLRQFLAKYYPKKANTQIYYNKTKEEWLAVFKENYKNLQPKSAMEYNKFRPKNTPTWWVFANLFGLTKWSELLNMADIQKEKNATKDRRKKQLKIISHSDMNF